MISIKCNLCPMLLSSVSDLLVHKSVHARPHIQHINFLWWLGRTLGLYIWYVEELDINGYEVSHEEKGAILYINPQVYEGYHILYEQYLKGTCKNSPCWQCHLKNEIRTMPEKRYMKLKMQQDAHYEPDKPRVILNEML